MLPLHLFLMTDKRHDSLLSGIQKWSRYWWSWWCCIWCPGYFTKRKEMSCFGSLENRIELCWLKLKVYLSSGVHSKFSLYFPSLPPSLFSRSMIRCYLASLSQVWTLPAGNQPSLNSNNNKKRESSWMVLKNNQMRICWFQSWTAKMSAGGTGWCSSRFRHVSSSLHESKNGWENRNKDALRGRETREDF